MTNPPDTLNAAILIVDDQEINIQLLEAILSSSGYKRISSTMDPHAVCGLHRANDYDLIPVSYTHLTLPTICSV